MKVSKHGLDEIVLSEGLRLTAYPDPATGEEPWTIGVGHTSRAGPPLVKRGMVITKQQAYDILAADLQVLEGVINSLVKVPLTQGQFDALVSFTFNVGGGAFKSSTMLNKLNSRDYEGAAKEFRRWNKAAGKVMPGLVKRRAREEALFCS